MEKELELNASTTTRLTTRCSGDLMGDQIAPGDQIGDQITAVTRSLLGDQIDDQIRTAIWSPGKYLYLILIGVAPFGQISGAS